MVSANMLEGHSSKNHHRPREKGAECEQRWLGHAQLSTTAIYAEAIGQEEQEIAARIWT